MNTRISPFNLQSSWALRTRTCCARNGPLQLSIRVGPHNVSQYDTGVLLY